MKKGKLFLTLVFAFVLSITAFAGCRKSENSLTISLETAKTTIVEALEIEEVSGQIVLGNSVENQGNRNIFAKLRNSAVEIVGNFDYGDTISGCVQRQQTAWTKYSLGCGDEYEYYDGTYVYLKNSQTKTTFDSSHYGIILQSLDCIYLDLLFLDEAFDTIYNDDVLKESTKDGYTYTMGVDMAEYVTYVAQKVEEIGIGSEGVFGEGAELQRNKDEGKVDLKITFDKTNNITKVEMVVTCCTGSEQLYDTIINVAKLPDEVSAPSWFDLENYQ